MSQFNTSKVNGNTVDAAEWNQLAGLNNAITSTGQTPSTSDLNQVAKTMADYAAVSTFYTDSGSADAYVLTPITTFKAPHAYINGMEIRFRAGNAGTGGAATVNVGGLGVESLKESDGVTNPSSIPTTEDSEYRYDGTVFRKINAVAQATESAAGIAEIATNAEAKSFTNDLAFMTSLKTSQAIGQIAIFEDQKANGTNGGTFANGAWQTRTLNTTASNGITGASLSTNQITLPAGTYVIDASAPANDVADHKAKIRNITDSTDDIIGSNANTTTASDIATDSLMKGTITIASTKVFEVQHRCQTTQANDGFGSQCGFGVNEKYTQIIIQKIA
jgi:hypothetical protein